MPKSTTYKVGDLVRNKFTLHTPNDRLLEVVAVDGERVQCSSAEDDGTATRGVWFLPVSLVAENLRVE